MLIIKKLLLLSGLIFISMHLSAQDNSVFRRASFGININQYQSDFGVGLQLVSPYWGNKTNSAIKFQYNFQYLQHYDNQELTTVWTSYQNMRLGYMLATNPIQGFFRYYGEFGGILLFPDDAFSDESTEPGVYGVFGFEFLFPSDVRLNKSVYLELGGVGTGAKAEKVETQPIYSNGFLISVGFRLFFAKRS